MMTRLRDRARSLRIETHALWLAYQDPRVPWYAKLAAVCVLAYALSPIDLIPDFIPVVGLLDDLLLLPIGVSVVVRLIPQDVLADCRRAASEASDAPKALGWLGAAAVAAVWMVFFSAIGWILLCALRNRPARP
jgi:uncharacterized membrane protein YkvA (DUF1232 family)